MEKGRKATLNSIWSKFNSDAKHLPPKDKKDEDIQKLPIPDWNCACGNVSGCHAAADEEESPVASGPK